MQFNIIYIMRNHPVTLDDADKASYRRLRSTLGTLWTSSKQD